MANTRSGSRGLTHTSKHRQARYRGTLKGWETNLLAGCKRRALRHGREFALTREWLRPRLVRGVCEATGQSLTFSPGDETVPSIDRKDSSLGYTPDNCWVVTWRYNNAKKDKPLHTTF